MNINTKQQRSLIKDRQALWQKLELVLAKIEKKSHSGLTRQELQELGGLYRGVAADLSRARAQTSSAQTGQELQIYLNNLAVRAHNQIYQVPSNNWQDLINFFSVGFPALVRKYSAYIVVSMLIFLLPLFTSYMYVQKDPSFTNLEIMPDHPIVSEDIQAAIAEHKLWTAGKEKLSPLMSSYIITNNIRVVIGAFALGITFAVGTVIILALNGLMNGTIFGACHLHGMARELLTFVVGHGFLELSAIFICGGAGLLMGTTLLFPGRHQRVDALKLVSKDAFCLFAGCIPLLIIAGIIEGFISGSQYLDPLTKYIVGISTFIALLLYLFNKPSANFAKR